MKVLIFHGYLLRGTGSNVYNASVATALARLGHEVHLLCQDRHAGELPWVDRVGTWEDGELRIERTRRASGPRDQDPPSQGRLGHPGLEPAGGGEGSGTVTVYLPDIGGLL